MPLKLAYLLRPLRVIRFRVCLICRCEAGIAMVLMACRTGYNHIRRTIRHIAHLNLIVPQAGPAVRARHAAYIAFAHMIETGCCDVV